MPETSQLSHYGVKRRSGRYPWGSGGEYVSQADALRDKGFSEVEIAKALGISTTELRNRRALASAREKEAQRLYVTREKESGRSIAAISRDTGLAESTIRGLLKPTANMKFRIIQKVSNVLKKLVADKGYVDIGDGVEVYLGITKTKLNNALRLLQDEGYTIHYLREQQMGRTGKKTSIKVLAAPGVEWKEVNANKAQIAIPGVKFDRDIDEFVAPQAIKSVSPSRVAVRWKEDGGADMDGIIELRRGVPEFDLGNARYAQVRIAVGDNKYMKGMAIFKDDLPDGVDIRYNVSKSKTGAKSPLDAMKDMETDGASPFGAVVSPNRYLDKDGNVQQGPISILTDGTPKVEGAWSTWSKTLASQVLSKQSAHLAEQQLGINRDNMLAELEEVMALTNPTVRNHILLSLADTADSAAVELKAAALPRQTTSVLLPDPKMRTDEIYAPQYPDGTVVSLIRYPHAGPFEIPTLTVNNKRSALRKIIGADAQDAVGIHPDVAAVLSGADFDGDTVTVIPNKSGKIQTKPPLEALKNFEPKEAYPGYPGMKPLSERRKQRLMGDVSNLITDMTIQGATQSEIARAVRHSMVVIDATKHELNYKQSEIDNGIAALKKKYQGSARAGAATLISKAKSQERVPARLDRYEIDPDTGKKVWIKSEQTYIDRKTGREVPYMQRSTKMAETDDAFSLIDPKRSTLIERVYAKYANDMKDIGNRARLETLKADDKPYSPKAAKTYSQEVQSLEAKYKEAVKSRPLQRKAQVLANQIYKAKLEENPGMTREAKRKEQSRAYLLASSRLGATRPTIDITPREWSAIEMGAISPTRLKEILRNADMSQIREYATPRATTRGLTTPKKTRAKALLGRGYTTAEVAQALGVPVSQIRDLDK